MPGQFIGDDREQTKGNNFGVLSSSDITTLKRENNLSEEAGDFVFLGREDYSSSTISGGISAVNLANSGYLDNGNYDLFMIVTHEIRQSGPYDMNMVYQFRNSTNTGTLGANNMCFHGHYLNNGGGTNGYYTHHNANYLNLMNGYYLRLNDSQATTISFLYNQGSNKQYPSFFHRMAFRSNTPNFNHNKAWGWLDIDTDRGGWRWSGYTTSTWNFKMDIYGYKESA